METKTITWDDIKSWDGEVMREKMRTSKAEIEKVLLDKQSADLQKQEEAAKLAEEEDAKKTEEEAEAAEQARLAARSPEEVAADEAAQKAEEEKVKAEAAAAEKEKADEAAKLEAAKVEAEKKALEEKERLAKEAIPEPPKKEKIVVEYQARDEEGNPIGRPTHLEADTWEEMSKKQTETHIQATRAFHRLKNRRDTAPKQEEVQIPKLPTPEEVEQALKDLDDKDPKKKIEAIRKLAVNEDSVKAQIAAQEKAAEAEGARQTYLFLHNHVRDYYDCEANKQALIRYMDENKLKWTSESLELAFTELEDQLAPIPTVITERTLEPVVTKQETVVIPPVPAPVVAPAPAAAPTPVVPPETPPNTVVVDRKLPAGGIEPGTLHGGRPVSRTPALTKQDVAKMPLDEYKKRLKDPAFRRQLNAIGIKA